MIDGERLYVNPTTIVYDEKWSCVNLNRSLILECAYE